MAIVENSPESVPFPALLIERATALARAEAGLALIHTRRIAIGAVSALLATIVACAFAQLSLLLLVAWPVLAARVPLANLLLGVVASVLLGVGAAAVALSTWLGVARERRSGARDTGMMKTSTPNEPAPDGTAPNAGAQGGPQTVALAERVSL